MPSVFAICRDESDALAGDAAHRKERAKSFLQGMAKVFKADSPLEAVQVRRARPDPPPTVAVAGHMIASHSVLGVAS